MGDDETVLTNMEIELLGATGPGWEDAGPAPCLPGGYDLCVRSADGKIHRHYREPAGPPGWWRRAWRAVWR